MKRPGLILSVSILLFQSCTNTESLNHQKLFSLLDSESTGITFSNQLDYNKDFNIYTYRNFYNGGGVGIADLNNDGLVDIYFSANMGPNKLYLNKGGLQFEDVTDVAGVAGSKAWSTGVSMADVNGDGWIDIYVCNSGDMEGDNKQNELFINNGDLTFTESAEAYGVADKGYSTHAAFFDYDRDGDLDLYLLNNSYQAIGSFNLKKNQRPVRDEEGGDKLLRNDGNSFTDVSVESGIYGSVIGFGLGVTVGDLDLDGWQDLFISNDFFERDYLYMNNRDGTFREVLEQQIRSLSAASMGADMADINNNGSPDIFVTEMLPEPNYRQKTVTTFESWDKYQYSLENGYYHQFTRNVLHLNNQNGTYSEIGRLAGVEATDWSWGALIFDMDNDGHKDIFVANGIFQDLTDQDYLNFISNEETMKAIISNEGVDYEALIDAIPSHAVVNYAFQNLGKDFQFENRAEDWGFDIPSFSNGSAYGDLDNDGDMDLVINNVNMAAFIYENKVSEVLPQNHYLKIELRGSEKNPFALGAKVIAIDGNSRYYQEQVPVKGFESSVDHRLNIGLGTIERIDSIIVIWPDQKTTILTDVDVNQKLVLNQAESTQAPYNVRPGREASPLFTALQDLTPDYTHVENDYIDFDREKLLYHMRSNDGPVVETVDFNNDGHEDLFFGGSMRASSELFLQTKNGFVRSNQEIFEELSASEVTDALFFDADNDGDQDLYLAHGSSESSSSSSYLYDVLLINDNGRLHPSRQRLPLATPITSSVVTGADFDNDGDIDLFVGERLKPLYIGVPCNGYLLENDGNGHFREISSSKGRDLKEIGMITDAAWEDVDLDGDPDLTIVGEYMPLTIMINNNGVLTKVNGPKYSNGWWNVLHATDLDGDGDVDFVAGNHGLNSRFRASAEKPVVMFINDFDRNGNAEQIICMYEGDSLYPFVLKHDLVNRIPELKKKYLKYESFKNETIHRIFPTEVLESSVRLEAHELASCVFLNDGKGNFIMKRLPVEAQFSPATAISVADFDADSNPDILLGGNQMRAKPEVGPYDASYGTLLKGDGKGNFMSVKASASGLSLDGEIREFQILNWQGEPVMVVGRNNNKPLFFGLQSNTIQLR